MTGNTVGPAVGPAVPSSGRAQDANQPAKPETPAEISAIDALQLVLDLAGMIPGAGAIPDLINAVISAARGNFWDAIFSAGAAIPAAGDIAGAAKIVKNTDKYLQAVKVIEAKVLPKLPASMRKQLEDYLAAIRKKIDELTKKDAPKEKAPEKPKEKAESKDNDGVKSKPTKTGEKGKCGEWLAKMDMLDAGFDEVVEVQNKSGHGIDIIGRNSQTGEVKVWEVKTTDGTIAPSLSKDQASMGGAEYTKDRLGRAAGGNGNYGKVPEAMVNADKAQDWIKKAERSGKSPIYEKREVFVDDLEKGCAKHPTRPSRSKPWEAKK